MTYKLMKHQNTMSDIFCNHNSFAFFAEQGTGKTLPTLEHCIYLLRSGQAKSCLIVAPLSALGAWSRDIELMPPRHKKTFLEKITLINYESAWRKGNLKDHYDIIILDEAHAITARTSKQAKFFIGYKAGNTIVRGLNFTAKFRYILTGTPISNGKLEQYYALMDFLEPEFFGAYKDFKEKYVVEKFLAGIPVPMIIKYNNVNELMGKVGSKSIWIRKKECMDLPDKLPDEIIYVPIGDTKIYNEGKKSLIKELSYNMENAMVRLGKLRQICSGIAVGETPEDFIEVKCNKINYLKSFIDNLPEEPIVIFANFAYSISSIAKLLDKMKIKYITLDGAQKDKSVWKVFQNDKSYRVILCQYKTASAGIDLFRANTMVFYEPPLSTSTIEQARDRIHRKGQVNKCSYYWLITSKTVELDIYNTLVKNQDFNIKCLKKMK